ncbi:MAG: hypothetical protein RR791_03150 [Lachnospiraceae bacterium]
MIDVKKILMELMNIPAPCGYEKEMSYKMKSYFEKFCDEVFIDNVGNCIGKISGSSPKAPKIMMIGHMDSVGLIIRNIDEEGFVQVSRLGGTEEKVLAGTKFLVRSEDGSWYPASIGPKAHHVTPPEEKYVVEDVNHITLDLGATSREELSEKGIHIGCPIVYKPEAIELMDDKITGTSVDNRGACATLIRMAELLRGNRPQADVYLVGTVWEEFNLRGALLASRHINPDICISLDVVLAGDVPNLKNVFDVKLGDGPCVELFTFHGRGTLNGVLPHEGLFDLAKKVSRETKLPLQRTIAYGMLMDSSYIQLEGKGVATLDMGFPARYTHTPVEICCTRDIEQLAQLCSEMTRKIDDKFVTHRF